MITKSPTRSGPMTSRGRTESPALGSDLFKSEPGASVSRFGLFDITCAYACHSSQCTKDLARKIPWEGRGGRFVRVRDCSAHRSEVQFAPALPDHDPLLGPRRVTRASMLDAGVACVGLVLPAIPFLG